MSVNKKAFLHHSCCLSRTIVTSFHQENKIMFYEKRKSLVFTSMYQKHLANRAEAESQGFREKQTNLAICLQNPNPCHLSTSSATIGIQSFHRTERSYYFNVINSRKHFDLTLLFSSHVISSHGRNNDRNTHTKPIRKLSQTEQNRQQNRITVLRIFMGFVFVH